MGNKTLSLAIALLLGLTLMTSCYHYRAQAPGVTAKTEPQSKVVWSLAWGLAQEELTIDNCRGQALGDVRNSTNFGFVLLTVVTIGFASPQIVEWRCAGAQPEAGSVKIPAAPPSQR